MATPGGLGGSLAAGDHEVRVTYYAKSKGLIPGAGKDLVSNPVRITVRE